MFSSLFSFLDTGKLLKMRKNSGIGIKCIGEAFVSD
jgi:hypothetical protein